MRKLKGADIQSVLDQLEALGWVLRVPPQRPGEMPQWHVNPVVHTKFADRAASEAQRRERSRSLIGGLLKRDESAA